MSNVNDGVRASLFVTDYNVRDVFGYRQAPELELSDLLETVRAEGRKQGLEEAAMFLLKKADKIGTDAKTIPLGAASGRRTFLGGCPAWDVEQFVVSIIVEDAAAIRALKESK